MGRRRFAALAWKSVYPVSSIFGFCHAPPRWQVRTLDKWTSGVTETNRGYVSHSWCLPFFSFRARSSMQFCESRVTRDYHCLHEVTLRLSARRRARGRDGLTTSNQDPDAHPSFFSLASRASSPAPPGRPVLPSPNAAFLALYNSSRNIFFPTLFISPNSPLPPAPPSSFSTPIPPSFA